MTQELLTLPPELFTKWLSEALLQHDAKSGTIAAMVADKAAQWGADQELEACKQYMHDQDWFMSPTLRMAQLHNARRPKPPSLKKQAIAALSEMSIESCLINDIDVNAAVCAKYNTIRRALEALDD